ncbi:hypothetical protein VNO77_06337 [Canavalia gladiata]|uniref:Uncharacterized protein n=1 Tax=Canavalia gladiata TaxID=3824 RepID=A0AAN9MD70_CANGL
MPEKINGPIDLKLFLIIIEHGGFYMVDMVRIMRFLKSQTQVLLTSLIALHHPQFSLKSYLFYLRLLPSTATTHITCVYILRFSSSPPSATVLYTIFFMTNVLQLAEGRSIIELTIKILKAQPLLVEQVYAKSTTLLNRCYYQNPMRMRDTQSSCKQVTCCTYIMTCFG